MTTKKGVLGASVRTGLLYSTLAGWLVSLVAVAISPPAAVSLVGIAIFLAAGVATTGIGRMFTMMSIDRIGASRHAPIQNSVSPITSVMVGILALSETSSLLKTVGVGAIVLGVWSVSRRRAQATSAPIPWTAFLLPVSAGLSIASGDILRKLGLSVLDSPEFGLAVGMTAALVIWTVVGLTRPSPTHAPQGGAIAWFFASGLAAAGAQLSLLHALNIGELSVVSPIANIQPLLVLGLSGLFLRDVETIDGSLVLGVLFTVTGVIATSLGG